MQISAFSLSKPPVAPVRPITVIPKALATLTALKTFFEFPDVLIASNTSFLLPNPSNDCAYISSASTSLQKSRI